MGMVPPRLVKGREKYLVKVLADHLRMIIKKEKNMKKPDKPNTKIAQRQKLGTLGSLTDDVESLDQKYIKDEETFEKKAEKLRRKREAKGEGSMFSVLQPFNRPELKDLVCRRIDVLSWFDTGLRWCQGEVVSVVENTSQPLVTVLWDPIPDGPKKYEEPVEERVKLLPSKWRKETEGAWRMDVDIEEFSDEDQVDVNDIEGDNEDVASESSTGWSSDDDEECV